MPRMVLQPKEPKGLYTPPTVGFPLIQALFGVQIVCELLQVLAPSSQIWVVGCIWSGPSGFRGTLSPRGLAALRATNLHVIHPALKHHACSGANFEPSHVNALEVRETER